MGTVAARRALDENMKMHISARNDPVMWNVCLALKELSKAIDELDVKVTHVSRQVGQVASRQQ